MDTTTQDDEQIWPKTNAGAPLATRQLDLSYFTPEGWRPILRDDECFLSFLRVLRQHASDLIRPDYGDEVADLVLYGNQSEQVGLLEYFGQAISKMLQNSQPQRSVDIDGIGGYAVYRGTFLDQPVEVVLNWHHHSWEFAVGKFDLLQDLWLLVPAD